MPIFGKGMKLFQKSGKSGDAWRTIGQKLVKGYDLIRILEAKPPMYHVMFNDGRKFNIMIRFPKKPLRPGYSIAVKHINGEWWM